MQGLITERHFERAERVFPGIRRFYERLARKPRTFLELVWEFERRAEHSSRPVDAEPDPDRRRPAR